jgi:hypothetical protein
VDVAKAFVSKTNANVRAADKTRLAASFRHTLRHLGTPSVQKASYAVFHLLTAAKLLSKDERCAYGQNSLQSLNASMVGPCDDIYILFTRVRQKQPILHSFLPIFSTFC